MPDRSVGSTGSITYKRLNKDDTTFEFTIETEAAGYWVHFGDGTRTYRESSVKTIEHTYSSFETFKIHLFPVGRPDQFIGCYSAMINLELGGA